MMQQTLQLAFSVAGRQTAAGMKIARKPVYFHKRCYKCYAVGTVKRNEDFILWFDCPNCGYTDSWRTVAAKIREFYSHLETS